MQSLLCTTLIGSVDDLSYLHNKQASCLHSLLHSHGQCLTEETADAREARQRNRRAVLDVREGKKVKDFDDS